jgi:hypothetical protein
MDWEIPEAIQTPIMIFLGDWDVKMLLFVIKIDLVG